MKNTVFLGLFLLISASSLQAANMRFLENSTLSQLKESELTALKKQVRTSLDQSPDKKIIKWHSEESELSAKIMVQFSFEDEGQPCRRMRFKFYDNEIEKDYYSFDICQTTDDWKISTSTITTELTKQDWKMIRKTLDRALESDEEGSPFSWFNGASKHSGVVVPSHPFTHQSKRCKSLAITVLDQQGHTAEGKYTFCKNGSEWKRTIL